MPPERDRDPSPLVTALIRREIERHERNYHPGETLLRITSEHGHPELCAGLVLRNLRVVRAAPIVGYMIGWSEDRVRSYAAGRGWRIE